MQQVPAWIVYVVGISNLVLCVGILIIAIVMILLTRQILALLTQLRQEMMPPVLGTLKNVEKISTDAADTTHNVTATANRISNLIGSAVNRLESPVIRAVGLASGVIAASRSVRGQKTVVVEKNAKVCSVVKTRRHVEIMSKTTYHTGEKIVIVAGPSFGQALKFILFGAMLGAGAVTYLKPKPVIPPRRPKGFLQDLAVQFIGAKFGGAKSDGAKSDGAKPDFGKSDVPRMDAAKYDPAIEDFSAPLGAGEDTEAVADRIESLTSRLKSLGARAKHLVETAGEAVKPTLETAIAEGKRVAAEVQTGLKKDVAEAGDSPAIAKEDGDLPSEKEDKLVE